MARDLGHSHSDYRTRIYVLWLKSRSCGKRVDVTVICPCISSDRHRQHHRSAREVELDNTRYYSLSVCPLILLIRSGVAISLFALGPSIGALLCIKFGDLLGRHMTIFFSTAIAIVESILMACSFSLTQLIVARIVIGVGSGGYTATIPVWQYEMSGAQHRGAFVNDEGIFLGICFVVALLIELRSFFDDGNSDSWRFPFALQIVLLIMVMAFVFTLPESPRRDYLATRNMPTSTDDISCSWLVKKGRLMEASEVLAALNESTPDSEVIQSDIAMIEQSLIASDTGMGPCAVCCAWGIDKSSIEP
ncbi:hypothetical protein P280DRAFT_531209 [Massarina eburnea CBS 473.64]|uniref:Major facilitator superfamily (MFS) profile domain-containing protein n=1 Tax=Massarina eburnea CBS 473.64 TaxID=1395130 RepID=A0A6A6SCC9_9PLEO|nr:hypothetical protein P280DRAFT_531209 [Massarina eburnea CBS 473.64]